MSSDFTQQFKTRGQSNSDQIPHMQPVTPVQFDSQGRPVRKLTLEQKTHIYNKFYARGVFEIDSPTPDSNFIPKPNSL